jgi:hypothetical protein
MLSPLRAGAGRSRHKSLTKAIDYQGIDSPLAAARVNTLLRLRNRQRLDACPQPVGRGCRDRLNVRGVRATTPAGCFESFVRARILAHQAGGLLTYPARPRVSDEDATGQGLRPAARPR